MTGDAVGVIDQKTQIAGAMASGAALKAYAAGRELLELLDTAVKPKDVADRVAALAARLAEEARGGAAAGARALRASNAARALPAPATAPRRPHH